MVILVYHKPLPFPQLKNILFYIKNILILVFFHISAISSGSILVQSRIGQFFDRFWHREKALSRGDIPELRSRVISSLRSGDIRLRRVISASRVIYG